MKMWIERIAEAEARERRWWAWPLRLANAVRAPLFGWPFTEADADAWTSVVDCPAGELSHRYGLDYLDCFELYHLGNRFGKPLLDGNTRRCSQILSQMDDLALEIKRDVAR